MPTLIVLVGYSFLLDLLYLLGAHSFDMTNIKLFLFLELKQLALCLHHFGVSSVSEGRTERGADFLSRKRLLQSSHRTSPDDLVGPSFLFLEIFL
jgi:hypothetical protein